VIWFLASADVSAANAGHHVSCQRRAVPGPGRRAVRLAEPRTFAAAPDSIERATVPTRCARSGRCPRRRRRRAHRHLAGQHPGRRSDVHDRAAKRWLTVSGLAGTTGVAASLRPIWPGRSEIEYPVAAHAGRRMPGHRAEQRPWWDVASLCPHCGAPVRLRSQSCGKSRGQVRDEARSPHRAATER
jgi:hypothetical protein